ncbi:MAG: hypothetical protein AAF228_06195 [Pseudomonadota bacterium]
MADSISSSVFGVTSTSSIFSAGLSAAPTDGQQAAQTSIDAAKQEINRIRGYKVRLTPADNKRLDDIQKEIQELDAKAANGTIRADEIEDRSELFLEADTIIGKPSAEVEADDTLEGLRQQIDALLAPQLQGSQANRLEQLERIKTTLEEQLSDGGGDIIRQQFRNVSRQIQELSPPRQIGQLSTAEKSEYDRLVEEVNNYAGAKLVLNAQESIRVASLESTINDLSSSLPPDPSSQPTAASVSRAYARNLL